MHDVFSERKSDMFGLKWINVKDALPSEDGLYWTISEVQWDSDGLKEGDIEVAVCDAWENGSWVDEDEQWKVIYWAHPFRLDVPAELADRTRIGVL